MSTYIHGTSPVEQQRLTTLNDLTNQPCLRELNLRGGERILDVGCGLMQFTRMMAREVGPAGGVVAIESSDRQRAEALRQAAVAGEGDLVDLRAGDAHSFPLQRDEWGGFDVVHTRFLLEHLRDPQRIVDQMVRAARPGGRVVFADDDHDVLRLTPPSPPFERLWGAYVSTYHAAGCDPSIGRHLVTLLHRAGAVPTRNTLVFFGSCAGQTSFHHLATNVAVILEGAREQIERVGLAPREIDAGLTGLAQWRELPDAALWYSICWAEGIRRG